MRANTNEVLKFSISDEHLTGIQSGDLRIERIGLRIVPLGSLGATIADGAQLASLSLRLPVPSLPAVDWKGKN